jgi:single-stranded-DNA-specific exonuclease
MNWNTISPIVPKNITQLTDTLLANRSIKDVSAFLQPKNPLHFIADDVGIDSQALELAVKRLQRAKEKQLSVVIFGDYDCDGVCATAVLWETLYRYGCKVVPFIPHREKHGYGLSNAALDEILHGKKPDILITVDNGIVAYEQFQRLRNEGVFTILTDHHQPDTKIPPADIIIHTDKLCGTTVAWMLANALYSEHAKELLDLCAIATIADQVPLTDANRSFAKYGLEMLNKTNRLGLKLLIESAGLRFGEIDSYSVNFGIAPRINAMGRLEHALDALRALCTKDVTKGQELISKLQSVNQTRQDMTQLLIEKARERQSEWENEHIIIVEDEEYHEGIIGLIASKLTEEFHKPTICISVGKDSSKASCRSVRGVHITNLLRSVREDLMEVGGHPMAAGFRVKTENISLLKEHLFALARKEISADLLVRSIDADCEIPADLFCMDAATAIQKLEPFGVQNREPVFIVRQLHVSDAVPVGKEGRHLKLKMYTETEQGSIRIDGIGFGKGDRLSEITSDSVIDVVGTLSINEWNGRRTCQMIMKDLIVSSSARQA